MNDFEKILTGGGMVFKKKGKDENAGEKILTRSFRACILRQKEKRMV